MIPSLPWISSGYNLVLIKLILLPVPTFSTTASNLMNSLSGWSIWSIGRFVSDLISILFSLMSTSWMWWEGPFLTLKNFKFWSSKVTEFTSFSSFCLSLFLISRFLNLGTMTVSAISWILSSSCSGMIEGISMSSGATMTSKQSLFFLWVYILIFSFSS